MPIGLRLHHHRPGGLAIELLSKAMRRRRGEGDGKDDMCVVY